MTGIQSLIELRSHMTLGERAAIEGILGELEPELAIEVGTAEGASLRQIAAQAAEVHSFDLSEPSLEVPAHVRLHTGDSHELLPRVLADFAAAGRNVDFALVDGDHTSSGVARDLVDLLDSDAVRETVILLHDASNEEVRGGLESVPYERWAKVTWVDLDFVPGALSREPASELEIWGGLGLVLVEARPAPPGRPLRNETVFPSSRVLGEFRDRRRAGDGNRFRRLLRGRFRRRAPST